jgi:hypothetical protein
MRVVRASDQSGMKFRDAARPGRIATHTVLGRELGRGVRVDVWLHAAEETDLFGIKVRCLFRDAMMDLVASKVFSYRDTTRGLLESQGVSVFTERRAYRLTHVPTGVPVNVFVARSDKEWAEFVPNT